MPSLPNGPGQLVGDVQKKLLPLAVPLSTGQQPSDLGTATGIPQLVVFAGFLGDPVTKPNTNETWRILYLDWALKHWLLVEETGILNYQEIADTTIDPVKRDALWVDEDASVGHGKRSQSIEAQFLTGEFTRAGDFEAPPGGGIQDAPTGVFCEARTPRCCYRLSRG